jgi:UDP-N-acetylmuramoylalanine--D-glutamate ligase
MRGRVVRAIVIGEAAPKIVESLKDVVSVTRASSLEDAVTEAREVAAPGNVVLLAPACASFDMFEDYEDRGRVFREVVAGLGGIRSREAS